MINFDYSEAFSRNLGLITRNEQSILKSKKIAIAGMGGVGGQHLQTLMRMGIEKFHVADMDVFELCNMNRQAGAYMSTLHQPKTQVMHDLACDINPECCLKIFSDGVTETNLDQFLEGVDLYVDGLDFFALDIRAHVFAKCREKGIPAITAGPIGLGTAYLAFDPHGMSFEEYFQFNNLNETDKALHFLVGLAPRLAHKDHIVDYTYVNFKKKKGPSLSASCQACSAMVGTESLKILLGRGKIDYAPWTTQIDLLNNKFIKLYNWAGNKNPLNKIKIKRIKKKLKQLEENQLPETRHYKRHIEEIIDTAKWAPSGDNSQQWFVSIKNSNEFEIDLAPIKRNTFNLQPYSDFLSTGMFLENARLAAQKKGYELEWITEKDIVRVQLKNRSSFLPPLYPYIKKRSVNRFCYKLKKIPKNAKTLLKCELDNTLDIYWIEDLSEKLTVAHLLMQNTALRFRLPDSYKTHKNSINLEEEKPVEGMPIRSLGISYVSQFLLKWVLKSESTFSRIFKIPGATLGAKLEADLLPAILCSSHFIICFNAQEMPNPTKADHIRAGEQIQRFWLKLTQLNMAMHPWYLPIAFSRYVQEKISFTDDAFCTKAAIKLSAFFEEKILKPKNIELQHVIFTGRLGYPTKTNIPRSLRKDINDLIVNDYAKKIE